MTETTAPRLRPFLVEGEGMKAVIWETSAGRARYAAARALAESGYLARANPAAVRCRRAPEHDHQKTARRGVCYGRDPRYLPD